MKNLKDLFLMLEQDEIALEAQARATFEPYISQVKRLMAITDNSVTQGIIAKLERQLLPLIKTAKVESINWLNAQLQQIANNNPNTPDNRNKIQQLSAYVSDNILTQSQEEFFDKKIENVNKIPKGTAPPTNVPRNPTELEQQVNQAKTEFKVIEQNPKTPRDKINDFKRKTAEFIVKAKERFRNKTPEANLQNDVTRTTHQLTTSYDMNIHSEQYIKEQAEKGLKILKNHLLTST